MGGGTCEEVRMSYDDMMKELKQAHDQHLGDLLDQVEVPDLAYTIGLSPSQLAKRLRLQEIPMKLMRSPRSHRTTNFISKTDALKIIKEGI